MAAKNPSFTTLHVQFFLATASLLFISSFCSHGQLGFSVDLVHRESPKSPFYDPSESRSDRLRKTLTRSFRGGQKRLDADGPKTEARLFSNGGEYLMELGLGSPPSKLLVIADTGSDITWTQCEPCDNCYNQTSPLFDPAKSRTYRGVDCDAGVCGSITGQTCSSDSGGSPCQYEVFYGDKSHTRGVVATDTLIVGSAAFRGFGFGCGSDNAGTFDKRGSGIVGLGNGEASLVSQLGDSIDHKFSYCLVPLFSNVSSSKINFGTNAVVSGPGTVSTPMLDESPASFYFLGVTEISVGNKRFSVDYNTIIDSGTTLTILPSDVYDEIESLLVEAISLERVADPSGFLSLCFQTSTAEPGQDFPAPPISLNFAGGATVKWGSLNTFLRVADDVVCLSLVGDNGGGTNIIGNLAQMNFLVGYDLQKRTVSFKPTDCTNN